MDERARDAEARLMTGEFLRALETVKRRRAQLDNVPPEERASVEHALDQMERHARQGLEEVQEYNKWTDRHAIYREHRQDD